jgi:hypothetical protein
MSTSLDDDPTDFEGILPVLSPSSPPIYKDTRSNAATAASAASVRAFTAQAVAFYFRAPVKAFFRTRVDYLAFAKSISPDAHSGRWSWRTTTPGLLANAVRAYGWRFIPEQLAPPLVANVAVGAALYTSYLGILGRLHEPSSHAMKVIYPPPSPVSTFTAGFLAGSIQSVIAAPLDALQVRFEQRGSKYEHKTMWEYGRGKLREIGFRGIFAGWGISFLKDSLGSGLFFCTFEYTKAQGYYNFVKWWYSGVGDVEFFSTRTDLTPARASSNDYKRIVKPHYAIEPTFLLLAGMSASITQQIVLYPLSTIQSLHYQRLESLDKKAVAFASTPSRESRGRMLRAYCHAYQQTWQQARAQAVGNGSLTRWLYRGFWWFTIRQVPSTSAGLIIFELVRRKYGAAGMGDEVRIQGRDGSEILLA